MTHNNLFREATRKSKMLYPERYQDLTNCRPMYDSIYIGKWPDSLGITENHLLNADWFPCMDALSLDCLDPVHQIALSARIPGYSGFEQIRELPSNTRLQLYKFSSANRLLCTLPGASPRTPSACTIAVLGKHETIDFGPSLLLEGLFVGRLLRPDLYSMEAHAAYQHGDYISCKEALMIGMRWYIACDTCPVVRLGDPTVGCNEYQVVVKASVQIQTPVSVVVCAESPEKAAEIAKNAALSGRIPWEYGSTGNICPRYTVLPFVSPEDVNLIQSPGTVFG